jgi:Flp pilus assembly pilin Flp
LLLVWCRILGVNRAGPERGATAVAYAVMIAIIAVLLAAGVWVLSDQISSTLGGGAECLANPTDCEGGTGGGSGTGNGNGDGGGGTTSTAASTTTSSTVP